MSSSHQTIYSTLALSDEELKGLSDARGPCSAVLGTLDQPGGDPLVGISYQVDYAYEEEAGAGKLCLAISGEARRYRMSADARDRIAVPADVCALVISERSFEAGSFTWGDPIPGGRTDYASRYDSALEIARNLRLYRPMDELREMARGLGIAPGRLRKEELQERIRQHPDAGEVPDRWPAWFADGHTLVLRADSGPCHGVLERLRSAVVDGALAITNYQVPFGGGLFLYDARDETSELVEAREARFAWYDERMAELAPVAKELTERGHHWFFLGKPSLMTRDGVKVVCYWLNGSGWRQGSWERQAYGWYTLDELLAEKFVADAKGRAA